jgi:hypothetical protein
VAVSAIVGAVVASCTGYSASEPGAVDGGGGQDATSSDAIASDDSSTRPDADSDGGTFCGSADAGGATFCSSFDDPDLPDGSAVVDGWDGEVGSVGRVASQSFSPPFALRAKGDVRYVYKDFTVPNSITIDFEVKLTLTPSGSSAVAPMRLASGGSSLELYVTSGATSFQENSTTVGQSSATRLSVVWVHVSLTLDNSAQTLTASIGADQVAAATNLPTSWAQGTMRLEFGVTDLYMLATSDVMIDDVLVRVR